MNKNIAKAKGRKFMMGLLMLLITLPTFSSPINNRKVIKNSINLNNTRLIDALALLSSASGTNVIASNDINDLKLNLYLNKGSSLKGVLKLIEKTNDLSEVKLKNSILLIKENKKLANIIGRTYSNDSMKLEGVKVELLNSNYGIMESTKDGIFVLSNIKPGVYIIKVTKEGYESQSTILRVGEGEKAIKDIILIKAGGKKKVVNPKIRVDTANLGSIQTNDKPQHTEVEKVKLKYTTTEAMVKVLNGLFKGDQLKIKEYPSDQTLILNGTSDSIEIAKKTLNELDNPVKQVRITAQIIETSNNLFEDLGFNWVFSDRKALVGSNQGNKHFLGEVLKNGTSSTLDFVNIFNNSKNLLNLSIGMLQTTNDLNISSVPSVTVVNGKEAIFKVTEEVNAGLKVTTDSQNSDKTEEPIYKEAGTTFKVIPIIREGVDGKPRIALKVQSEISNFEEDPLDKSNYKIPLRLKKQNNIDTSIELVDGATVFIGGLKKKTTKDIEKKVPVLGSIPYLGALFRKSEKKNEVKQIYIEIKAEVIKGDNKRKDFNLDGFKDSIINKHEILRIYPKFGAELIDKE